MRRRTFLAASLAALPAIAAPRHRRPRVSRIRATADVTLYVSPSGNDANDGLSTTYPMKTITAAVRRFYYDYDMAGYWPLIKLLAGTYTESVDIFGPVLGHDQIAIHGDLNNWSAVQWVAPAGQTCCNVQDHGIGVFNGMTMSAPNGGGCIVARQSAVVDMSNIRLGDATIHVSSIQNSTVNVNAYYNIVGNAQIHMDANNNSVIVFASNLNLSATYQMNMQHFLKAGANSSIVLNGATYSGPGAGSGSTGSQGMAYLNGVVSLGGTSGLPGNSAATTQNGGQWVS